MRQVCHKNFSFHNFTCGNDEMVKKLWYWKSKQDWLHNWFRWHTLRPVKSVYHAVLLVDKQNYNRHPSIENTNKMRGRS